jgi:hypothetical protein
MKCRHRLIFIARSENRVIMSREVRERTRSR